MSTSVKILSWILLAAMTSGASPAWSAGRIGFINMEKAVAGTREWKKEFATFKAQFQKEKQLISAKEKTGIEILRNQLLSFVNKEKIANNETIITNIRHYNELNLALEEVNAIMNGIKEEISSEFLSVHIRQAVFHLGSITGEVTNDTLLNNIFANFCIGK